MFKFLSERYTYVTKLPTVQIYMYLASYRPSPPCTQTHEEATGIARAASCHMSFADNRLKCTRHRHLAVLISEKEMEGKLTVLSTKIRYI